MKPIKHILVALILFVANASISNALNPPIIQQPADGSDSLNPAGVAMKCNLNGGAHILYQLDVTPQFNSPDLKQQQLVTQYFVGNNLHLNKTYYWRAKTYNSSKTDSSNWSQTFSFTTSPGKTIRITDNYEYEQLGYIVVGLNHTSIGVQIKVDTIKSLNSPFANTSNFVPFDSTKYYFSYRSYFQQDTSVWSEVDSFNTGFRQSLSLSNYCVNGKIELRSSYYTGVYSSSPNRGVRFQYYEDDSKTTLLKDTFVANSWSNSIYLNNCAPVYCVFSTYGSRDTVSAQFYTDPCASIAVNQLYARLHIDSIRFGVPECADSVEIQFDKDTLFNTSSLLKEVLPTYGKRNISKYFEFNEHPVLYVYRARMFIGGKWSDWVGTYNTIVPSITWAPSTKYLTDSTYLRLQFYSYFYLPTKYPTYSQEYQFDTTESFNSPELKKLFLNSGDAFYDEGFIYAKQNFIRMRLLTPGGKTAWSNVIEKKTLQEISFRYPPSGKNTYPYSNPAVKQVFEAGPFEYQYCLDSNFQIPPLISALNARPELDHNKTYYVRVRGLNPIDTSEWSQKQTYVTINTTYVLHPDRISPVDSSHGVLANPTTFTWQPKENDLADRYFFLLYIDTVMPNKVIYYKEVTGTTTLTIPDLPQNRKFFWTVIATGSPRNEDPRTYSTFNTYTTSSLTDLGLSTNALIYPNPIINEINIRKTQSVIVAYRCIDAFGKEVKQDSITNSNVIPVHELSSGVYVIQLKLDNGTWVSQKFIKQ